MFTYRPTIFGTRHAISCGHYLASAAGFSILEAGGNAVDAGCAAGITLGVVQPDIVNVAGVAPIIVRMADGTMETIAGLGNWPRSMPADYFMREHAGTIPDGVLRTVVPAAPDAWITALARHGTMSFGDIAATAIRCAREGFAVHSLLADTAEKRSAEFARWPSNAALFLPGGSPVRYGDKFVQSDLADTLTYMADEERAAAGGGRLAGLEAARSAFYRGDIAREIVAYQTREGGFLSMDDLANYRSPIEPAVSRKWRGDTVITCGAWCQGPALIEALLLVERIGIAGLAHNSADYLHVILEALNLAMADREHFFGDPAFVDVPIDRLLSDESIASRAAMVRADRAFGEMPRLDATATPPLASMSPIPVIQGDTSYASVTDRWGNVFSATPSDSCYDVPIVPGLGVAPSGRGSQSRPDPTHPAGVAPGKRPRLTPSPALLVLEDGGTVPLGTPGGDVQIQAMLQVILNLLHFGMDVQEAVEAPRVATFSFPNSFAPFDYLPGRVAAEARIDPTVRAALADRGHQVEDWPAWTRAAGCVELIRSYPAKGLLAAGADPRRPAYAIAV